MCYFLSTFTRTWCVVHDAKLLNFYSLLDSTSGYHHIALSPEVQKKSTFVSPFGKFEFKELHYGLAQASTPFNN